MDDTIRRLRESGTSIREIKRLVGCGQARIMRALETPMDRHFSGTRESWTAISRELANRGLELDPHEVKRRYLFLTEMARMDMRLRHQPLPGIETLPMPEWVQ